VAVFGRHVRPAIAAALLALPAANDEGVVALGEAPSGATFAGVARPAAAAAADEEAVAVDVRREVARLRMALGS
jgi:hypothetical protein